MEDRTLIRIGGVSALAVAATQLVGNGLHPPMPRDTIQSLEIIQATGPWTPVHLIITASYFLFVPFVIGAMPAFRGRPALVRIAAALVLVGATLGVAQITTHLTIFHHLAAVFASPHVDLKESAVFMFNALWPYSVALEVAHLLAIFISVGLFGLVMLRQAAFPRWIGILGIIAGAVACAAILVGKFVITTRAGDLIFGASLLPLVVWIVASGIVLLRLDPPPPPWTDPAARPA